MRRSERIGEEVVADATDPQPELGRRHLRARDALLLVIERPGVEEHLEYHAASGGFARAPFLPGGEDLEPHVFWRLVADRRLALLREWAGRASAVDPRCLADVRNALGINLRPVPLGALGVRFELWGRSASISWDFADGTFRRTEIEAAFGVDPYGPVWGPGGSYAVASTPDVVSSPRPVHLVVRYPSATDPMASVRGLTLRWAG